MNREGITDKDHLADKLVQLLEKGTDNLPTAQVAKY